MALLGGLMPISDRRLRSIELLNGEGVQVSGMGLEGNREDLKEGRLTKPRTFQSASGGISSRIPVRF